MKCQQSLTATIHLPFAQESQVRHLLTQAQATILHCDYSNIVSLAIELPAGDEQKLKQCIINATQGEAQIIVTHAFNHHSH
jgi:putative IMPACT (imprinted ancient) family translation regulator